MSIANVKIIDNGQAPASTPTWGKNVVTIVPSASSPSKQPEALGITREELAILNKLTATPYGTWFEFKIHGCNRKRQIKFSWYSPTTRSYIFVGPNGMQIASLSERTLAHDLYVGNARILERQKTPIISRFLNTIHSKFNELMT